jgi:hypothetical protein
MSTYPPTINTIAFCAADNDAHGHDALHGR